MPLVSIPTPFSPQDAPSLVANGIDWSSRQAMGLEIHVPVMGHATDDIVRRHNVGEVALAGNPKQFPDHLSIEDTVDKIQLAASSSTVGGTLIPASDDFTISVWAMTRASTGVDQRILADSNNSGGNTGYWLEFSSVGPAPQFNWWIGGALSITGPTISRHQWVHLVHMREGDVFSGWVDGVLAGTVTNSGAMYTSASGTQYPSLGQSGAWGGRNLDGAVADFRVYHRAVGAPIILEMYHKPQDLYIQPDSYFLIEEVVGGATPKGPLGHPLHGPLAGPVGP